GGGVGSAMLRVAQERSVAARRVRAARRPDTVIAGRKTTRGAKSAPPRRAPGPRPTAGKGSGIPESHRAMDAVRQIRYILFGPTSSAGRNRPRGGLSRVGEPRARTARPRTF